VTAETVIAVDIRINARWIIPIEPANTILENHSLMIQGDVIAGVVPSAEADEKFRARETIDLSNHVLLPGLINMHGHAAMALFRGMADDLPLMTWLNDHIWPAEGRFVSDAFVADGTRLAMAEMIRTGTTTFSDMYFFPETVAQLAQDVGIRAQVTFPMLDFPTAWGQGPDEYFSKGEEFLSAWRGHDFVFPAIGPHAPYTVSDAPFIRVAEMAAQHDVRIQVHMHETAFEVEDALAKTGVRPLTRVARLGLAGDRTQFVHMTQIDDLDIQTLNDDGGHVIHCPQSNLKLASGFCPVHRLQEAGVNVAIGTDGAASNNDHDLFGELETAAMLAKAVASDAEALSAHKALKMATLDGAKALGKDGLLGSLVTGKQADLIAVDLSDPFIQPVYDPASHLVYSNHGRQVTHSWIAGVPQLQDGQLTRIDVPDLTLRVQHWRDQIRKR